MREIQFCCSLPGRGKASGKLSPLAMFLLSVRGYRGKSPGNCLIVRLPQASYGTHDDKEFRYGPESAFIRHDLRSCLHALKSTCLPPLRLAATIYTHSFQRVSCDGNQGDKTSSARPRLLRLVPLVLELFSLRALFNLFHLRPETVIFGIERPNGKVGEGEPMRCALHGFQSVFKFEQIAE